MYTEIIGLALSIVDKTLDHVPNYEQRKKEKYHKLKKAYLNELIRADRDDNLVIKLELELRQFLETFDSELRETDKNSFV